MNEIMLSEEQLEELASLIAEKLTAIMQKKENDKIERSLELAKQDRLNRSFRVS